MSFKFSPGLKLAKVPQIMGRTWNVKLRTVEVIEAQSFTVVWYSYLVCITQQELRGMRCLLASSFRHIGVPIFKRPNSNLTESVGSRV